jgi:hypothetical protein
MTFDWAWCLAPTWPGDDVIMEDSPHGWVAGCLAPGVSKRHFGAQKREDVFK